MADGETGETKPTPKQEGAVINLIVKDQTGAEVHFKVRRPRGGPSRPVVQAWTAAGRAAPAKSHHQQQLLVEG
jgi:hypothetical protein